MMSASPSEEQTARAEMELPEDPACSFCGSSEIFTPMEIESFVFLLRFEH